jgi:hypothetical protein
MKEHYIHVGQAGVKYYYNDRAMTILHREDGPAVDNPNGDKYWYINNQLHRKGGPAIALANGCEKWYWHGKLHRKGGPAITFPSGATQYWFENQLHREDGPAIAGIDLFKSWYINGKKLSEEEFNERKNSCEGKIVEVDGKKYRLTAI